MKWIVVECNAIYLYSCIHYELNAIQYNSYSSHFVYNIEINYNYNILYN